MCVGDDRVKSRYSFGHVKMQLKGLSVCSALRMNLTVSHCAKLPWSLANSGGCLGLTCDHASRPFLSCFEPHSESEAKCQAFHVKISFVCI